jgi:hypothetical protein
MTNSRSLRVGDIVIVNDGVLFDSIETMHEVFPGEGQIVKIRQTEFDIIPLVYIQFFVGPTNLPFKIHAYYEYELDLVSM